MSVIIREATMHDLDWVLAESELFDKFFDAKFSLVPSRDEAEQFFRGMISNHLFLISENNGVASGFICGLVTPSIFKKDITTLTELLWWVAQEYRHTRAGLLLLEEFISWGKDNVKMINFSLEEKSPIRDETLTRRGFKLKERAFTMECV